MKKKQPKKPVTPYSQIKGMLRKGWLRSRERAAALKRDGYTCVDCGRKQSKAKGKEFKIEVDHLEGCDIEKIVQYVRRHLFVPHDQLETVCVEDHKKRTAARLLVDRAAAEILSELREIK